MLRSLAEQQEIMARLQAEELALRERLRTIQLEKSTTNPRGDTYRLCGETSLKHTCTEQAKNDGGNSDSEFYDAVSDLEADNTPPTTITPPSSPPTSPTLSEPQYPHLPDELILQILSYITSAPNPQPALATCCLLSRQWYDAAIVPLYTHPRLYGNNYEPFVRSVCPSLNPQIRRSPLADLVRVLDLSALVHQGTKSGTARLLGRTKDKLEEFVAPRASFSFHCFPPLSKCRRLRVLDLSLVCEAPPLPDLFRAISGLEALKTLRLPRSTGYGVQYKKASFESCWPRNLKALTLSGGIDAHFLHGVATFPESLTHLTIEHCPLAKPHALTHLLRTAIRPLTHLTSFKIAHMQRLSSHALDDLLLLLPQITRLSVAVEYITPALFDAAHYHHHSKTSLSSSSSSSPEITLLRHENLRTLELTTENPHSPYASSFSSSSSFYSAISSGHSNFSSEQISPLDIIIAIDEGTLPALRQVRVAQSLAWLGGGGEGEDVEALTDVLQDGAKRDWEAREWVFKGMGEAELARGRLCWESVSGVWVFEG